ncbi:hypothetical protein EVAR_40217_1 [Eumeta japonica]|uniref:RNA-directed DNA polymerase from mobile element jockey n=1 Tax=Eumeta variegata TaxID=151549 RepID=A0A4C1X9J7_EUMVA|nr:hypothetical protein EVAR_40217_1 [Eumeta japonica]
MLPLPLLGLPVAIFNAYLRNCYFSPIWKEVEVIDIHKPGKPRDLPASYRPLSLPSGLGVQLALFADDTVLYFRARHKKSTFLRLQSAVDKPSQWFRTWRIKGLRTPNLAKFLKDASKRFFYIAGSHPNALLHSAVDYEPPQSHHFICRPRNVLTDPPDALTAAVDSLMEVNDTHDRLSGMSRAVDTPAWRPAAFGEAIVEVQLYTIAEQIIPTSGEVFSGFQPHTTRVHGRAGVRIPSRTSRRANWQTGRIPGWDPRTWIPRQTADGDLGGAYGIIRTRPRRHKTDAKDAPARNPLIKWRDGVVAIKL